MIRLIACDLDGTLLDPSGALPAGVFDRIRALRARGVLFAAASGRQLGNLQRIFFPVGDGMAFVCENGAHTVAAGRAESHFVPRDMAEEIIRDILEAGMEVLLSVPETSYVLASASKEYADGIVYGLRNTVTVIDDPAWFADGYIKLSGYRAQGVEALAPPLQAKWGKRLHVDLAGSQWLDFTCANKGDGIRALSRLLGIPAAEMAAFGDQFNDESMLDAVGYPYLMDTAPGALRGKGYAPCRSVLETLDVLLKTL